MYQPRQTKQYKKDIKIIKRQGKNLDELKKVISKLLGGEVLPKKYCDHELKGNWKNHRECHIDPDWLLIYRIDKKKKELTFTRTGSHSELFKK